jgi:ubiquinone/menaquinone biosynthesis C-methylase UbiE
MPACPYIKLTHYRFLACYFSMAVMATEVDPVGIEPLAVLQSADFRNARVLEVGAGDGRLTFRYATEPRSVVGIDTKEPEIRSTGKESRAGVRGQVRFLCASGNALPFSAQTFEIVLLASSL